MSHLLKLQVFKNTELNRTIKRDNKINPAIKKDLSGVHLLPPPPPNTFSISHTHTQSPVCILQHSVFVFMPVVPDWLLGQEGTTQYGSIRCSIYCISLFICFVGSGVWRNVVLSLSSQGGSLASAAIEFQIETYKHTLDTDICTH